jgi:hypothetical protein
LEGKVASKRRVGEGIEDLEDLGENHPQISFDRVLEGADLAIDVLSFPGQDPKFMGGRVGLRQALTVGSKELSDGGGAPLICFGLRQGELGKVRDEQGVEKLDIERVRLKEGGEVQIVGTRRLHSKPKRRNRGALREQRYEDIAKPLGGHGERSGPKKLALVVDQRGMEAILGDIDAAKVIAHEFTSSGIMKFEAGNASRAILHFDKGSRTQSTYQDSGGQRTDSVEGSRAQNRGSFSASSLSFYSI